MKNKNNPFIILTALVAGLFFNFVNPTKFALNDSIQQTLCEPISTNNAECFIKRFVSESDYYIPEEWLFEKEAFDTLITLNPSNESGIRFYSAINKDRATNEDTLTLVMVSTVLDNGSGIHEDDVNYKSYEFSQICPKICSKNYQPIGCFKKSSDLYKNVTVPRSWFFTKENFISIFDDPTIKGLRLRQYVDKNNVLNMILIPVTYEDGYYNNQYGQSISGAAVVCQSGGSNCDQNSVYYKAATCK